MKVAPDVPYTVYKRFCVRLRWCASRDVRYICRNCMLKWYLCSQCNAGGGATFGECLAQARSAGAAFFVLEFPQVQPYCTQSEPADRRKSAENPWNQSHFVPTPRSKAAPDPTATLKAHGPTFGRRFGYLNASSMATMVGSAMAEQNHGKNCIGGSSG